MQRETKQCKIMAKQTQQELIPTTEQTTNNQILQIELLIRIIRGQQVLLCYLVRSRDFPIK